MKILYKPFGIIAGVIAAKLGQSVFKTLWARVDQADPPHAGTPEASLQKVVVAQALQAATHAGTRAAVDRLTMRWFHYLTGFWPGDKPADEDEMVAGAGPVESQPALASG